MTFRDRVRVWLLGEEIGKIATLSYQVDNLTAVQAQGVTHEAQTLAALARIEASIAAQDPNLAAAVAAVQVEVVQLAVSMENKHAETVGQVQSTRIALREELQRLTVQLTRIGDLFEPIALKPVPAVPFVPSWDAVQANQLKEFEG